MPLLAYSESGEPLVAPLMSDDEWERIRSAKDRDAWMPQSQRRAIPKVSRLGTRFFAHPPGHAPEGAKESDLHLYLKAQCLIGARAAGWEALPEQSGRTPEGQDWRQTSCALFTFRYAPREAMDLDDLNKELIEKINNDGRIYLTQTTYEDRFVIRFQVGQTSTSRDDVMEAWTVILKAAQNLPGPGRADKPNLA